MPAPPKIFSGYGPVVANENFTIFLALPWKSKEKIAPQAKKYWKMGKGFFRQKGPFGFSAIVKNYAP